MGRLVGRLLGSDKTPPDELPDDRVGSAKCFRTKDVRLPTKSGRQDLNLRPQRPERCALAKLSYAPLRPGIVLGQRRQVKAGRFPTQGGVVDAASLIG